MPWQPVGRVLVWLALAILFVRGIASLVMPAPASRTVTVVRQAGVLQPSASMLWIAEAFARAYMSDSSSGLTAAGELMTSAARSDLPSLPSQGSWSVRSASAASWTQQDASSAVITVDVILGRGAGTYERFLAVPVAQTAAGVAVDASPAFVAAPMVDANAPGLPGVNGSDPPAAPAAVVTLLGQFFSAFFSGGSLTYFEAPGAKVPQPATGLRVSQRGSVSVLASQGDELEVLADVTVSDTRTGVSFPSQYVLVVRRLDRWVVSAIEGTDQ